MLLSVPYALKAADAETFGGKPPSAYAPAVASEADSTGGASTRAVGSGGGPQNSDKTPHPIPISGSGTANYLPLWTNASTLSSSVIYQNPAGGVGIGTTSPSAQLDVHSNLMVAVAGNTTVATSGVGVFGSTTLDQRHQLRRRGFTASVHGAGIFGPVTATPASPPVSAERRPVRRAWESMGKPPPPPATPSGSKAFGQHRMDSAEVFQYFHQRSQPRTDSRYGQFRGHRRCTPRRVGASATGETLRIFRSASGAIPMSRAVSRSPEPPTTAWPWKAATIRPILLPPTSRTRRLTATPPSTGSCHQHGRQLPDRCRRRPVCNGTKSGVVPVDGGSRKVALYAVEAPENWFEISARAVIHGSAVIAFETTYAQTVNSDMEYHVSSLPPATAKVCTSQQERRRVRGS